MQNNYHVKKDKKNNGFFKFLLDTYFYSKHSPSDVIVNNLHTVPTERLLVINIRDLSIN